MLIFIIKSNAQCSGLAIVGYNTSWDTLVLEATAPIAAGTVYYICDNEWSSTNNNYPDLNEGETSWTAPAGGVSIGTKIILRATSSSGSLSVVNIGTLGGNLQVALAANDDIYLTSTVPLTTVGSTTNADICMHVDYIGTGGGSNPTNSLVLPTNAASARYSGTGSITNASNWVINTGALPIDLIEFKVKIKDGNTLLSFSTATETNNSHFIIERSADARTFSEIGQARGAGTTQEPHDYTFTDEKPLNGTNYYRLRQVDYDGTESFSPVVSVVFGKTDHITIAPSPATDRVNIHLEEALNTDGRWQVFDNTGRQILSGAWEAESADYELDVNILPEGMYTFRLMVGSQVQVKQFRKL